MNNIIVNNAVLLVIAAVAASLMMLPTAEAALYTVGDDLGWTIPPGGAATYAAWAAKHSFVVKDILGQPKFSISLFSSWNFATLFYLIERQKEWLQKQEMFTFKLCPKKTQKVKFEISLLII